MARRYFSLLTVLLSAPNTANVCCDRHGSVLHIASYDGYGEIVQLLLDRGADVNAQGGEYSNALRAASWGGHEKVVQILLDRGADVNAEGKEYGSALQAASYWGYEKIVQMLLDKGADVNAKGGWYGSALQAASAGGRGRAVEILLSLCSLFEPRMHKDGSLMRPKRILMWGRAGMGKTTLCKKIVHEVYKNKLWKDLYDRVIWLPLRRLKRTTCRTIVDLLHNDEFAFSGLGDRVSQCLNKLVYDDRTLFLLDGLDEVSLALEFDSPGGRILSDLLSRANVIVTSRPHSTRLLDHKPADLELETVGVFPSQVEEYLQHVATKSTITEIRSFIQTRPLVQSLAAILIQLDAICYTWNIKSFPRNNATVTSLYLAITQNLWENIVFRLEKRSNKKLITKPQLEHWPWRYLSSFIDVEISFLQELSFRGLCQEAIEFNIADIAALETSCHMPSDELVHLLFLRTSDSSVNRRTDLPLYPSDHPRVSRSAVFRIVLDV